MKRAEIITIIPSTGFAWEDRSGASFAVKQGKTGYSYDHEPVMCLALCEFEDEDGTTWREVRGVTRWAEPGDPETLTRLDDIVPTIHLECGGQCEADDLPHWQTLPKAKAAG